jgi:hypothetical protein
MVKDIKKKNDHEPIRKRKKGRKSLTLLGLVKV